MAVFTVAAVNMDLIIGIIAVIAWIIAQSAGSKKKQPPPGPPRLPSEGPGDALSPNEDLREFFRELERGLTGQVEEQAEPSAPPALPPPMPHHRAARGRQAVARPAPAASRPAPVPPAAAPEPAPPMSAARAYALRPASSPHRCIMGFGDRGALQRMIVASEVLAPPLALRKPGMAPLAKP